MTSIYGPNALELKTKNQSEKQGPQEIPELSYTVITSTYLADRAMLSKWVGITELLLPS